MRGIDYSFARPAPADIKNAGFEFVVRYVASSAGKRISKAEADALRGAGLALALVFEDTVQQPLNGFSQGVTDAQIALNQARGIGFPDDRPIYFAVDFDTTEGQQAAIDGYLTGVASVLGGQRVGVYGSYYVMQRCKNSNTARWFWQTLAWSGGQQFDGNHLYQTGESAFNGGADVNEARQGDFGQWSDTITGGQDMTQAQAQELSLYIRLLAFEGVDEANSHSDDDVRHMLADPAYAGAIAKAVYSGEWQTPAWKAGHYDEVAKKLDELGHTPPPAPEPTPTPDPAPSPDPAPTPAPAPSPGGGSFKDAINNFFDAILRALGRK